jgi:hypothetical protein
VTHRHSTDRHPSDPPDADDATTDCECSQERKTGPDLGARGPSIRRVRSGMRGNRIPEEDVVRDAELGENAVHNRRTGLGQAGAGELALRRERNPGDARTG